MLNSQLLYAVLRSLFTLCFYCYYRAGATYGIEGTHDIDQGVLTLYVCVCVCVRACVCVFVCVCVCV